MLRISMGPMATARRLPHREQRVLSCCSYVVVSLFLQNASSAIRGSSSSSSRPEGRAQAAEIWAAEVLQRRHHSPAENRRC